MSKPLLFFSGSNSPVCLATDIRGMISGWQDLSPVMIRKRPSGFGRDEWAYLIEYLDRRHLEAICANNLGNLAAAGDPSPEFLLRPRGTVGLWLPNNVSLLGPLMLVLCSLSGNALKIKGGSRGLDLTGEFLNFAQKESRPGEFKKYLKRKVSYSVFGHADPAAQDFLKGVDAAIVFGADESVIKVKSLPQSADCLFFGFPNRDSQAWIEPAALNEKVLTDLLKTFAVYGQAGCSSPSKVMFLGATPRQVKDLVRRIGNLWPVLFRDKPAPAVASSNVASFQEAKACGWEPLMVPGGAAVIACGSPRLPVASGRMCLHICAATIEQARDLLPDSIQTVGYAVVDPKDKRWLKLIAASSIKRFVPIAQMQHLGPVWDGVGFWRGLFEEVQLIR